MKVIFDALDRLLMRHRERKGRFEKNKSFYDLGPNYYRFVDGDRCVDFYVERDLDGTMQFYLPVALQWHGGKEVWPYSHEILDVSYEAISDVESAIIRIEVRRLVKARERETKVVFVED